MSGVRMATPRKATHDSGSPARRPRGHGVAVERAEEAKRQLARTMLDELERDLKITSANADALLARLR